MGRLKHTEPESAAVARPTKFSDETFLKITDGIALGMPLAHAARCGGVVYGTFRRWLRENPRLREAVKVAAALAVQRCIVGINAAAEDGTWQAAAWWLERRHPDEFGSERRQLRELRHQHKEIERRLAEIGQVVDELTRSGRLPARPVNRVAGLLSE